MGLKYFTCNRIAALCLHSFLQYNKYQTVTANERNFPVKLSCYGVDIYERNKVPFLIYLCMTVEYRIIFLAGIFIPEVND